MSSDFDPTKPPTTLSASIISPMCTGLGLVRPAYEFLLWPSFILVASRCKTSRQATSFLTDADHDIVQHRKCGLTIALYRRMNTSSLLQDPAERNLKSSPLILVPQFCTSQLNCSIWTWSSSLFIGIHRCIFPHFRPLHPVILKHLFVIDFYSRLTVDSALQSGQPLFHVCCQPFTITVTRDLPVIHRDEHSSPDCATRTFMYRSNGVGPRTDPRVILLDAPIPSELSFTTLR